MIWNLFLLVQNAILLSSSHMSFDACSNLIAILLRYNINDSNSY